MTTLYRAWFLASLLAFAPALPAQKLECTSASGRKFYSLPDDKGVVAAARKSLEADPKSPDLLLKLAQAQAAVREEREAIATCARGLAIAPENDALYTERGHRELPLREFTRARDDLSRAAKLNPKNMAAYYHLGLAHYFLGDFGQAADAFQHAVDTAPNTDERIYSTNWLYASLRRAHEDQKAAQAAAVITGEMKNTEPHTLHYLNLVRLFQGVMKESEIVPPQPSADSTDTEAELRFDTVAYGVGNWYLYGGDAAKARDYFRRIVKGRVWITWGFIGAEVELARQQGGAAKGR
jgi:tetratricopeptide (TPR) repeat protein